MAFFHSLSLSTTFAFDPLGYLDPSAGSMMFQVILAGLISGMFFLRTTINAVKQRISQLGSSSK